MIEAWAKAGDLQGDFRRDPYVGVTRTSSMRTLWIGAWAALATICVTATVAHLIGM
jgi:hypothetical protein